MRLVETFFVAAVVLLVLNQIPDQAILPASVIAGGTLAGFAVAAGVRFAWRLNRERRLRPGVTAEPVVVVGAGEGGEQTVTAMLRDPDSPYLPVAIIDDDPTKARLKIRGVRVMGDRTALAAVAAEHGARVVVIAIPGARSETIRELAGLAVDAGLEVRVLPPVSELFGGAIGVGDIRPVTEADLLGREMVETDLTAIAGYLQDRRVLVTGAGGSIGSEICRQVAVFGPAELVMLDRDESALHALQLDLSGRAMLDSRNLVVADIRDRDRMFEVFREHRPQVVFHAAALKHLPLLEMHPCEGVKTNVYGTLNVLDAAGSVDVTEFVNISTDKAADPTSVLGYSKRLAEGLTTWAAGQYPGRFLSVRFGNVLGSRGSVLTAFRSQIEAGGPVTVTDPDVTRYFMTVSEAVHLVVQAGAVGADGEALVLDMGEPVKIDDVARQLVAQSPRPVEIVYTGLRPGEKLHEVLLAEGENDHRPAHPLISHVVVPVLRPGDLDVLHKASGDSDDAAIPVLRRMALETMAPGASDDMRRTQSP
nr:nucleoside-diphosphate sugar epimerase/dehydratase [Rhabdothermincola salaria]